MIAYVDRGSGPSALYTYCIKLLDRTNGTTDTLASTSRNGSGSTGFNCYLTPYFSADGARVGWTKGYFDTANEVEVYDLRTGVLTTYHAPSLRPISPTQTSMAHSPTSGSHGIGTRTRGRRTSASTTLSTSSRCGIGSRMTT